MRNPVPLFPDASNPHNPNAVLVHQEDIVRPELAKLLAVFLPITTDRREAQFDQDGEPGTRRPRIEPASVL